MNKANQSLLRDWPKGEVWFRERIPEHLAWGDEALLEEIPESARGTYGLKVGEYTHLDDQRYEPGNIITVETADQLLALMQGVEKVVGVIVPWYDRLIPPAFLQKHHSPVELKSYRADLGRRWIKSLIITLALVGLAFLRPEMLMIAIMGATFFGLFPLVEASMAWLRRVDRFSVDDLNRRLVRNEFFRLWVIQQPTGMLKVAVGVLVAVFAGQYFFDAQHPTLPGRISASIQSAALVRTEVLENGEWWRLVTTGLMHGGVLHILFNGMALYSLGRVIVALVSPSLLSIVFLVSVVTGSLASIWLGNAPASVGASGGILGCLGFLLVVTQKFKEELPGHLRSSLVQSSIVIAIFGFLGSHFIDNAAHLGGFAGGIVLGEIFSPSLKLVSGRTKPLVRGLSVISVVILVAGVVKVGWELWQARGV